MNAPPVAPRRVASYRLAVLALCAVVLAWRAFTVSRWTWSDDDWAYTIGTQTLSFWDYVFQKYNSHLMPAEFLLHWLATALAPLQFAVPVVVVSCGSALAVWVWSRVAAELVGEHPVLVVPLGVVFLSPLLVQPTAWWASALQVVPLQVCAGLVVLSAARAARTGARRDLGALVGWLLLALAFWEKGLFLVLPAVTVLLHRSPGTWRTRLRAQRATLAVLAVLSTAYLATFLAFSRARPERGLSSVGFDLGAARSPGEIAGFVWRGAGDVLLPGMLGGPWGTLPTPGTIFERPSALLGPVCLVVVAAIVGVSAWRAREPWLPLGTVAGWVLASWGLILFSERYEVLGLGSAAINEPRYVVDTLLVVLLALLMLWGAPRRTRSGAGVDARPRRRAHRTLAATACVAAAASLGLGNVLAVSTYGVHPGRAWVRTVTADVDRRAPVSLLDASSPDAVLLSTYWPQEGRLSRMLSPLEGVSFGGPAEQLWQVRPDGRLRAVQVGRASGAEPGPDQECGYAVAPGTTVDVPMTGDLYDWTWVVQVNGYVGTPATLRVEIADEVTTFRTGTGASQRQFAYTGQVPAVVRVAVQGGTSPFCLTDLLVGEPQG